jgi:hypothetical protein
VSFKVHIKLQKLKLSKWNFHSHVNILHSWRTSWTIRMDSLHTCLKILAHLSLHTINIHIRIISLTFWGILEHSWNKCIMLSSSALQRYHIFTNDHPFFLRLSMFSIFPLSVSQEKTKIRGGACNLQIVCMCSVGEDQQCFFFFHF